MSKEGYERRENEGEKGGEKVRSESTDVTTFLRISTC